MSVIVEIVKIISPIIVALSAAATAFFAYKGASFAYKGLSIWREQHSGKIESDLATQLLASIYRYRDVMNKSTDPFMNHIPNVHKNEPHISEEQKDFQKHAELEFERYDKIISMRQETYPYILKSEALWGDKMRSIIEKMSKIEIIIRVKIIKHLIIKNPDETSDKKQEAKENLEKLKSDDELSKQLDELVTEAEDYLKPKILLQNPNSPPQPTTKKGTK